MKNNKKYLIIFIAVFVIGIGIFLLFLRELNGSLDASKIQVTLSKEGWSTSDIAVTVKYNDTKAKITDYSFDGGKTWQKNNTYTVNSNGKLDIVLKSSAGMKSSVKEYNITNIDKEGPIINVQDNIKVVVNSEFNINDYIKVTDNVSGVKGKYTITPKDISTSEIGSIEVSIRAVDNAGNETVKLVNVEIIEETVVDNDMKKESDDDKEYRYREVTNSCVTSNEYSEASYDFGNITCDMYGGFVSGKYCLSDYIVYDSECSSGKMIDGQCHDIKSVAKVTCPSGSYDEATNKCLLVVNNCKNEYGDWSEWSKEKIEEAENIEIETREIAR